MADYDIHNYRVVVGNIGEVYNGKSLDKALEAYRTYMDNSKAGIGRAAGEPVTVFKNGNIRWEYEGSNAQSQDL